MVFNLRFTLPFDKFPNIDRVKNINCPIFVIHGTRDEIVPFYHAEELHKKSKFKHPPLYVDGAGHNNVEKYAGDLLDKVKEFLEAVKQFNKEHGVEDDDSNLLLKA